MGYCLHLHPFNYSRVHLHSTLYGVHSNTQLYTYHNFTTYTQTTKMACPLPRHAKATTNPIRAKTPPPQTSTCTTPD